MAAAAKVTLAVHLPGSVLIVMLAGQVIFGSSVSLTVTEKLQLVALPAESVVLQLTVVVPLLKVEPLAGVALHHLLRISHAGTDCPAGPNSSTRGQSARQLVVQYESRAAMGLFAELLKVNRPELSVLVP